MNRLKTIFGDKLILITGGSSGIGQALARKFIDLGANVYIIARRLENLTSTILELKSRRINANQLVGLISTDVASERQVQSILEKFMAKVGVPDYVINCAGTVVPGTISELDANVFHSIMNVNFFGTVNVTKAVLPGMLQRGSGHIVNISSFLGFFASYGYSAYASSKFAVRGFSDVIRAELKPQGIKVSIVFPADTDTPQLAEERKQQSVMIREINALGGLMSADTAATKIIKGISQGRYIITPGFMSTFVYALLNVAGYLQYPIIDLIIADAIKKHQKPEI